MLPSIIREDTVRLFKFWLNGGLQDGMYYQNELYYRLKQWPTESRSKLYKSASKLSRQGADVVVTVTPQQCSLWASLRNQKVAACAVSQTMPLPPIAELLEETPHQSL